MRLSRPQATAVGANSTPTLVRRTSGTAVEPIPLDADDYVGSVTKALDAALGQ